MIPVSKKDCERHAITAEAVKEYRERHKCSLQEARSALIGQKLRTLLEYGHTIEVLKHLVNVLYPPAKN